MLEKEDIQNFFKDKSDVNVEVLNLVIKIVLKDGTFDHNVNAPNSIAELETLYQNTKAHLSKLEGKISKDKETGAHIKQISVKDVSNEETSSNQECGGCNKKEEIREVDNSTWGLKSLAEAQFSGDAPETIQKDRYESCKSCQIKDLDGNRLFREIDGKVFCGIPRLGDFNKIKRDERHWGCGCELPTKVLYNASKCPFLVWDAVTI